MQLAGTASYHKPQHINITAEDLVGNNDIGRYILLPGSSERANLISSYLENVSIKQSPRHHDVYLGSYPYENNYIDIAIVSTGMGTPSADIILSELLMLGAKRFLRVGTAGSLKPEVVEVGDIVIATASVRDEKTSWDYIYPEFPAVASIETVIAANRAAKSLNLMSCVHNGIIHTKSSLYAREFGQSKLKQNTEYMDILKNANVLATDMETSHLYILSSINTRAHVVCGSLLAIVGDATPYSDNLNAIDYGIERLVRLAFETVKELFMIDNNVKLLYS